jgi:putative addiction module component (TIGR02574 family)
VKPLPDFQADTAAQKAYCSAMSKAEIVEELPKLTPAEREEIRLKLAELDGNDWLDEDDPLTAGEKALLNARLAAYEKDPDAGSSWEEVEARIRARLKA